MATSINIARHDLGDNDWSAQADDLGQAIRSHAAIVTLAPADSILTQAITSETWTYFRLADDPQAQRPASLEAATAAARSRLAVFALAAGDPGEAITVDLGVEVIDTACTGPSPAATLPAWLDAYWWAQVSRQPGAMELLARFDLESLAGEGQFDEYWRCMYRALIGFDAGDPQWPAAISAAMGSIDRPEISTHEESMYLVLDLFGMLATIGGEQAEFDAQLEKALTSHRQYWSATPERQQDPRGFMSLPILALAAKALDSGMTINVDSDYLPRGLLNPDWLIAR